jgi:hypothetical protein
MRIAHRFRAVGLAAAAVAVAGLLSSASVPAAAGTGIPVPNGSFEDGWAAGKPRCWHVDAAGPARLTVTQSAHSGSWAAHAAGQMVSTARLELSTDRSDSCQVAVVAGRPYTLSFWARSTTGLRAMVSVYSRTAGWRRWYTGPVLPATSEMHGYVLNLPATPADVTRFSVGWSLPGNGTMVVDDVSLREGSAVMRLVFPRSGLVTNEFAYWNPTDTKRVESPDWEMTSGSLFARAGSGYTGTIDAIPPDVTSSIGTDSAVFRLNTREFSFRDVRVSMNLKVTRLASTPRTPPVDWDGVHIFLHYQSEYELYYASVARRDGHVVIKKKCRGGRSNGGTYYVLGNSERGGIAFPSSTWQSVGASVRTNADGTVTIELYREGKIVTAATDTGVGCAPITNAGATGIRGDNAEFDFDNFTISALD